MAIWSTEVDGLESLIKACAKLPEEALKDIEDAAITANSRILDEARANVPVSQYGKSYYGKTSGKDNWNHPRGFLKKNIKLKKPSRRRKNKYVISTTVGFGKGAMYGVPLELGHDLVLFGRRTGKHIEGKPFLRKAADDNKGYVTTTMMQGMNKALEKFSNL